MQTVVNLLLNKLYPALFKYHLHLENWNIYESQSLTSPVLLIIDYNHYKWVTISFSISNISYIQQYYIRMYNSFLSEFCPGQTLVIQSKISWMASSPCPFGSWWT